MRPLSASRASPGARQHRPERHPEALVKLGQPDERAVQIDRLVDIRPAATAPERAGICRAHRPRRDDSAPGTEHSECSSLSISWESGGWRNTGNPKGRLGDEDIASAGLERRAGRVRPALVVAGNHDPGAAVFEHDLGAAEHVAGRHEAHRHIADCQCLAIGKRLQRAAGRARRSAVA